MTEILEIEKRAMVGDQRAVLQVVSERRKLEQDLHRLENRLRELENIQEIGKSGAKILKKRRAISVTAVESMPPAVESSPKLQKSETAVSDPLPDITAGKLRDAIKHLSDNHPVVFMADKTVFCYTGLRSFTDATIIFLKKVEPQ